MIIKQLSIFLENRPGRIAEITRLLADHDINLRALSIADTSSFGILRIIVDDADETRRLLSSKNITSLVTEVISVPLGDKPGALADILEKFAASHTVVEYLYCFHTGDEATAVLRVDNIAAALRALDNKK